MTIINEILINNNDKLDKILKITFPKYSFKLIDLELAAKISKTLRTVDKKLSGLSVPNLYDIPVVLRLIYAGINKYEHNSKDNLIVKLNTEQIIRSLYLPTEQGTKLARVHLRHIFLLINEYVSDCNKAILYFKLKRNSPCVLTIYPEFFSFASSFLKKCSQYSVRLYPYAQKKLDVLKKKERAYALFLEKLYFQGKMNMQGAALSAKTLKLKSSFEECKSRIRDMFNNPNSKHIFSFSSFMKKALNLLDEYKYDDLFFNELSNKTIREQNKYGNSQLSTYIMASQNHEKEEHQIESVNNTVPCNSTDASSQFLPEATDKDTGDNDANEYYSNLDEYGSISFSFNPARDDFDSFNTGNELIGA
ncbi:hypothetical protein SAMN02745213_01784 [Succinivibrio dextrinosolvens DSM 3072]|uniref:Uncharacterized protein n=1 Tax=Succinivibrio dextrinosolvens DSM 3072 TaxID=1123324 RepID=A0A1T4VMR0_9GAMM|nr:hypothetical protein [Succinivibrio dextrinosolvens]SKA66226.1 hypothetical protein SAMN02745213_01784 [Succinivibrio dextrinosolvens DSM 3072]